MFSSFDVITVVTISGILAILALYITVVYKKGWLGRNHVESHFLCPNQKCRKIFTQPVWLTDLSKSPPESYPACPHCSINLDIIPFLVDRRALNLRPCRVPHSRLKNSKNHQQSKKHRPFKERRRLSRFIERSQSPLSLNQNHRFKLMKLQMKNLRNL